MSTKLRILEVLSTAEEVRLHDLVESIGVSRQMIHRVIKKLVEQGKITKVGTAPRTYYKLTIKPTIVKSSKKKNTSSPPHNPKPLFNKRIFWDVAIDNIDYKSKAYFVIERIFERGDVDDIRNCRRYYGDEKVRKVLLEAKFLPETRMYLASAVINRPLKDFKCYTLRQSNPTLFPY